MKAKAYKWDGKAYVPCLPADVTHLAFQTPLFSGQSSYHMLRVILKGNRDEARQKFNTPVWTWNGSIDKPTLRPSVLSRSGHFINPSFDATKDECWCSYNRDHPDDQHFCCYLDHTWITDGQVKFLDDCSHELKGQTLDLLDVEP